MVGACTFVSARPAPRDSNVRELGEAAGAAAGDRHHMQVEHDRRWVVGGALGQQPLDDGEPRPVRHGSAAIAQDRARRVVAPLLQHAVQQIEIGLTGIAARTSPATNFTRRAIPSVSRKGRAASIMCGRSNNTASSRGWAPSKAASSPP